MKLTTQKPLVFGDFSIIKSNRLASFFLNSRRLTTICLLLFSSTLLVNFNAFPSEIINQQVPAKKAVAVPAKSSTSAKIVKGKAKGKKGKKSVVVKKDTLIDLDPGSANSPLYNN
ncbi:MAG: hypothetical protein RLZZ306_2911 [Bacteroidota bacterium]